MLTLRCEYRVLSGTDLGRNALFLFCIFLKKITQSLFLWANAEYIVAQTWGEMASFEFYFHSLSLYLDLLSFSLFGRMASLLFFIFFHSLSLYLDTEYNVVAWGGVLCLEFFILFFIFHIFYSLSLYLGRSALSSIFF